MARSTIQLIVAFALAAPVALWAQQTAHYQAGAPAGSKAAPAAPKKMAAPPAAAKSAMTDAQKIADAEGAAPPEISKHAAVMDWPDTPKGKMRQIRAGTNGWTCMPVSPGEVKGGLEDPMCFDKAWQGWADAWMAHAAPKPNGQGIAYMLKGDKGASNTDPFAMAPTPTNDWVVSPPHVMVLFADPKMADAFSSDPKNGGPWVMFKGTPYAHLMVPVSMTMAATMSK